MAKEPTIAEIVDAIADEDRYVTAVVDHAAVDASRGFYRSEAGVVVPVYGARLAAGVVEVLFDPASQQWVPAQCIQLNWNLCDGCKAPVSACCCDELEAERAAEYGPRCSECGSDGEDDYGMCPLQHIYEPGDCPRVTGVW